MRLKCLYPKHGTVLGIQRPGPDAPAKRESQIGSHRVANGHHHRRKERPPFLWHRMEEIGYLGNSSVLGQHEPEHQYQAIEGLPMAVLENSKRRLLCASKVDHRDD